ncbi:MAG: hypothetical protein OXU79_19130 [Gemmatimonadota bacterium]|nr:hypothetical protein [Gemmatimonadota bacterium]
MNRTEWDITPQHGGKAMQRFVRHDNQNEASEKHPPIKIIELEINLPRRDAFEHKDNRNGKPKHYNRKNSRIDFAYSDINNLAPDAT